MTDRPYCTSLEYDLGLRAWREKWVRLGKLEPRDETERRWRREGPRPSSEFETARAAE